MIKILIIGSKGFIGSYLVRYFTGLNYDVWQCDIVNDYNSIKYFQIDATNSDYKVIFEQQKFDVCINCSGAASVPDSLIHPHRDFLLNTVNVYAMLDAIRIYNHGCRFINLSSAAVYGNPKVLPIRESHELTPMSPYGCHKLMSEQILKEFSTEFHEKTCSLRIFSAFGIGLKKQLFWDMNKKMEAAYDAEFWGTGDESRDFIHVNDIAQVILLAIEHTNFNGEAINVANGVQTTIRECAYLYARLKNFSGDIIFNGNVREGDPRFWQADISMITKWGYKQTITLEQGLKEYIKWAENI